VDSLPPSLLVLTFGCDFNQKIDQLPSTLTHITFGKHFSHPMYYPPFLTNLKFGDPEHHSEVVGLSHSLPHLHYTGEKLPLPLPPRLTHLTSNLHCSVLDMQSLPSSLVCLHNGVISGEENSDFFSLSEENSMSNLPEIEDIFYWMPNIARGLLHFIAPPKLKRFNFEVFDRYLF
jgi:hypothetical protein